MKRETDFATVTTTELPEEASEVIVAAAVEQLKKTVGMRNYALVDQVADKGAQEYTYYTFEDLTAAYDLGEGEDFKYDSAGASKTTKDFVKIAKGFKLSWEANQLAKLNVRAAQTKACVTEVRDREDNKLIAALSDATSSVTATAALSESTADPIKDVRAAIRSVEDLGYSPDILLIENVNLEELVSIIGSNEWYRVTERTLESGSLPIFMGMKVISTKSANLSHGTAYVFKSGPAGALQLGQATDVRTHIFDDDDSQCTKVQVYERVCPALVRPDAVAKISGW